jgi:CDP-4-dehydro-6-deoxyglucose reductase, E1
VITCAGNGGMVMTDRDDLRDRAVMLRRWGRRSELHYFGSKRRDHDFWQDLDGIHYDNQFIFDELGWNFEPSEMGAAFGLVQLAKLEENLARRRRHFDRYSEQLARHRDRFALPQQLDDLDTAWLGYPLMIEPEAGFERADLQEFLDRRGIDTRTIWTGNVTRQPMLGGVEVRVPPAGLPEADAVMERGVLLPLSHAIDDETLDVVIAEVEEFLTR